MAWVGFWSGKNRRTRRQLLSHRAFDHCWDPKKGHVSRAPLCWTFSLSSISQSSISPWVSPTHGDVAWAPQNLDGRQHSWFQSKYLLKGWLRCLWRTNTNPLPGGSPKSSQEAGCAAGAQERLWAQQEEEWVRRWGARQVCKLRLQGWLQTWPGWTPGLLCIGGSMCKRGLWAHCHF